VLLAGGATGNVRLQLGIVVADASGLRAAPLCHQRFCFRRFGFARPGALAGWLGWPIRAFRPLRRLRSLRGMSPQRWGLSASTAFDRVRYPVSEAVLLQVRRLFRASEAFRCRHCRHLSGRCGFGSRNICAFLLPQTGTSDAGAAGAYLWLQAIVLLA